MNYQQLFETIKGYVENDFPGTTWTDTTGSGTVTFTQKEQVDTFIRQAEQRIYNTVQFPSLRKNVTGVTSTNNKYLSCPADFLSVFSMAVVDADGNGSFSLAEVQQAYPALTAEDFQSADFVSLTDGRNIGAVLGNGGVHGTSLARFCG